MEFQNFSFYKFMSLNLEEQKKYFTNYFIPLNNGMHCMLIDNQFEMITDEILNRVYLRRCGKKIKEYYTEDYKDIKTPVYKINKPLFFDDKINLCPQLPIYKPYKDFDKTIQYKVNIFLDFIKEILASGNDDVYNYIIKWNANMCKGNKNDSALVFKTTAKGVGKSSFPVMMRKYILGEKLSLESGSEPLKSKFNSILGGKLFVYFEELETFTSSEWVSISSVLKRQITSDTIILQKKGQDAYETDNINNYILLTNHDVDDDGRRYFVADISTHRKGDIEYWSNLYDKCFNNEVGYALYCYFFEIDTKDFKAQQFPITKNKLHSISKRLDGVYLFLKENFILNNTPIDEKLTDLYEDYKIFCFQNNKRACARTDFITKLSEIQINFYKTNGYNKYKVSLDILKQIAKNNNWINEADEFNNLDDNDVNDENKQNEQEEKDYKTKYEKLLLIYKKLKNSINENENENENIVVEEEKININIDVVEDKI